MGRLTVRLPDTLHFQLTTIAEKEGVSLNQYIVYALTRQTTLAYIVETTPPDELEHQRLSFKQLLDSLSEATPEEISQVLAEREVVEPKSELEASVLRQLQDKLAVL